MIELPTSIRHRVELLLKKYKNTPNAEFEIRFKIDEEIFKLLFTSLKPTLLEQNIDIITPIKKANVQRCSNRKTITFETSNKKDIYHIQKCKLDQIFVKSSINYKLVLSSENQLPEFSSNAAKLIRLKLRVSVNFLEDWRLDLTLVREIDISLLNQLQPIKDKMFPQNLTLESFLEKAPFSIVDRFELEIEHVSSSLLNIQNIETVLTNLFNIIDPNLKEKNEHQEMIYKAASYIVPKNILSFYKRKHGFKHLVNQPIGLIKDTYNRILYPNISNYYLTDKADGERCLAINQDGVSTIITSTKLIKLDHKISNRQKQPTKKSNQKTSKKQIQTKQKVNKFTMVDAELVDNKIYLFDVLVFENKNLTKFPFQEREKYLEKATKLFSMAEKKIMVRLTDKLDQIKKVYERKDKPYPIDGLIFIPTQESYLKMKVYKWKPIEKTTIDFLIVKAPNDLLGIEPYRKKQGLTLYILMVGIRKDMFIKFKMNHLKSYNKIMASLNIKPGIYFPIQFSPTDNPYVFLYYSDQDDLHGHVGEFLYTIATNQKNITNQKNDDLPLKGEWKLERLRPDRDIDVKLGNYFGNDFKTADMTWQNYQNPLTLEYLLDPNPKHSYFQTEKGDIYYAPNGFNSFVKSILIKSLSDSNLVIDLASGKGQDLFRFINAKIKKVIFVDQDPDAMSELNKRKYNIESSTSTKIHTHLTDLTKPYKTIIDELSKFTNTTKADAITLNFAIHYFVKTMEDLRNLVQLVDHLLKDGGKFIFTTFEGQKVFKLLKDLDYKEYWNITQDNVVKYSIQKLYRSNKLTQFGQEIAIKLPFSGDDYYKENLVNLDVILREFKRKGFQPEILASFEDYLPQFSQKNKKVYDLLTDDDKRYVSLYTAVSLWKNKD